MTISIVMALAYKNFVLLTVPTPPGVGLTVTVGSSPVAGWLNMGAADDGNYFTVAIFDCDGDGNPNGLVELIFNATAIANIADNAATSPFTNLYVSLHTSSPGAGGSQTTNEAAYTSYARVAVARTSGGWTVTGSSVVPAATVSFSCCDWRERNDHSFRHRHGIIKHRKAIVLRYGQPEHFGVERRHAAANDRQHGYRTVIRLPTGRRCFCIFSF